MKRQLEAKLRVQNSFLNGKERVMSQVLRLDFGLDIGRMKTINFISSVMDKKICECMI